MLVWLPFEDTSTAWIVLFAGATSALLAVRVSLPGSRLLPFTGLAHFLIGMIAGAGVTPIALLLMAFKSGIHGHGSPDFTPEQVMQVLNDTPLFALAGGLAGLGIGLYRFLNRSQ